MVINYIGHGPDLDLGAIFKCLDALLLLLVAFYLLLDYLG
jgi:hypothetical protein